ncbi:MAG: hypothetical protein U1D55_08930 [Phycisphaerae bacterium]
MINIADCESKARQYLAEQLGRRAPKTVRFEQAFEESPLDGEGPTAILSFDLAPSVDCGMDADARHYVAVGDRSNYFPSYGLSTDDAYSFHIGTRFALELEISRLDDSFEPPTARANLEVILNNYAPDADRDSIRVAGVFRCDEQYFVVYRVRAGGRDLYCFGADCPPGFSELVQHPPQVALRLHLGRLIRAEAAAPGAAEV